ncbi:hypothetical protein D3C72_1481140 [compost metagenome]
MSERSEISCQVRMMPAARAMAIRCMVWLVEPPVACRPTTPLTTDLSSIISPAGVNSLPCAVIASARFVASRVSASRSGVPGLTKEEPGIWKPMISISIWLELAVP